jgi:hypothetical protein
MAASTPDHASSAWGSAAILAGLPNISDMGGDEALEGPSLVEVVPFSPLNLGAALVPVGVAVVAGGASGVLVVLAIMGAAGSAPVISGVPPALGGSVVLGAVAAPRGGWCICGLLVLFFSGGVRRRCRCGSGCRVRTQRGLAGLPLLLFLLLLGIPGEEKGERG